MKEVQAKCRQAAAYLAENGCDAMLISQHENIAWLTAGLVEVRVGVLRESGAASLLVTRDGRCFCLTTNNEVGRIGVEEVEGTGIEIAANPWAANDVPALVRKLACAGKTVSDKPQFGYEAVNLQPLRATLTEGEAERYRWLGRAAAEAATQVLLAVRPGMTEIKLEAMLAAVLLQRGILPSVFLTAVDERALGFKHPVPRQGVLKQLAMIGFCARRWGLSVSITRWVQFGAGFEQFAGHMRAMAEVNARLQAASRTGATADSLFQVAAEGFAANGFAGEEFDHHQGGATGFLEREWIARPGGGDKVSACQAFAWNPNLRGAKIEDTVLLANGSVELLTATPQLPSLDVNWQGRTYPAADVLRME
jgi:antitoxin VapB